MSTDDPCACVPWRTAYTLPASNGQPMTKCGDGYELHHLKQEGQLNFFKRNQFCVNLYQRMKEPFCFNLRQINEPDAWDGGQWCYVSKQCAGSTPANGTSQLNVKFCQPGRQEMLREMNPVELFEWYDNKYGGAGSFLGVELDTLLR